MTFHAITAVSAHDNYKLRLVYSDGTHITIDFKPVIDQGGVFKALADSQFFSQVVVKGEGRYIEWPGDIDFCADALRLQGDLHNQTESSTLSAGR